jgi:hypothetical protein
VTARHRLGAEELIELGRVPTAVLFRQPYFMGRPRRAPLVANGPALAGPGLGILDILGSVAGFLADGLGFALGTLGDLVDIPLGILSQGVDIAFNGVADLLRNIPIVGDLLAQILVLGGSLVKFGLSIPGLALHGLGNVMAGIGKALKGENSDAQNQEKVDDAKKDVVDRAPLPIKESVKAILDASGVSGRNLTPGVGSGGQVTAPPAGRQGPPGARAPGIPAAEAEGPDIGEILAVGVPVAGAAALLVALAS